MLRAHKGLERHRVHRALSVRSERRAREVVKAVAKPPPSHHVDPEHREHQANPVQLVLAVAETSAAEIRRGWPSGCRT